MRSWTPSYTCSTHYFSQEPSFSVILTETLEWASKCQHAMACCICMYPIPIFTNGFGEVYLSYFKSDLSDRLFISMIWLNEKRSMCIVWTHCASFYFTTRYQEDGTTWTVFAHECASTRVCCWGLILFEDTHARKLAYRRVALLKLPFVHLWWPLLVCAFHVWNSAVGHNLGGEHPFHDGYEEFRNKGDTGGLMDYS